MEKREDLRNEYVLLTFCCIGAVELLAVFFKIANGVGFVVVATLLDGRAWH